MTIQDWIEEQENDRRLSTEQFYARLKSAVIELQDRLACADADGIDLDHVQPEELE